jgi:hypothetical protein
VSCLFISPNYFEGDGLLRVSSLFFDENKPAPEIKMLTKPIKNNFEAILIKRFIAVWYSQLQINLFLFLRYPKNRRL